MLLYYLRENGGSATVKELAEQIAALENDLEVGELQHQQQKRVYVSLYQTHVPKLEETGIIEYDESQGMVRLTARAGEFDSYLTTDSESEYPWQFHYFGLAMVGGLLFVLSSVGVPGFAALSTVWLGVVLMALFALSAGVQYWTHKKQQQKIPTELLEPED